MKIFGNEYKLLSNDHKKNQSCNLSYDSDASDNEITRQKRVMNINMSPKKLMNSEKIKNPSEASKQSKKSKVIVISLNDLKKDE